MISLPNPLTVEERLQVPRLIGHDSLTPLIGAMGDVDYHLSHGKKIRKEAYDFLWAVIYLESTVMNLTSINPYPISKNDLISKKDLEKIFGIINSLKKNKVSYDFSNFKEFHGIPCLIYSVMHNLAKNGIEHNYGKEIEIHVEKSGFPNNASFIPDGAHNFERFIAFKVHDGGRGFKPISEKSYQDYFTIHPQSGRRGFGLYFTGLVAKVLMAPIEINSKPGDTTVTFYHPIYKEI